MTDLPDHLPKHLELIQAVVDRHARSSFLLKGWSVTLVSAIVLLAVRSQEPVASLMIGL